MRARASVRERVPVCVGVRACVRVRVCARARACMHVNSFNTPRVGGYFFVSACMYIYLYLEKN